MKKFFALMLTFVLLMTLTPVQNFAAVVAPTEGKADSIAIGEPSSSSSDPTDEALQNAILEAKSKITIPVEYSKFNYYYSDSSAFGKACWSLSWNNPNTDMGINVNIDADNHIIYFYKYDYKSTNSGVAKYLKSELEPKAEVFIAKIAPETIGFLELVSSEYTSSYNGDYIYTYQRVNNNIDFPDNSVTVNVNSITGEVTMASINWLYDASIPSVKDTITKDKATALLKENLKMKLVYRSNNVYMYDKGISSSAEKAFLVYEPSESYVSVDAITGKIYTTRNQYVTNSADEAASETGALYDVVKSAAGSSVTLTTDEIKKIEELKKLITKTKAINVVTENNSLYKDDNLTKKEANLNKIENNDKTTYVWNITLSDPRETTATDNYRGYVNASVDAQTGMLLSYYSSVKSTYNTEKQKWDTVTIKYNKKQSKEILEKFLKSQAASRFANSVLASENDDYIAYYQKEKPIYGGYSYVYNRTNESIEYPENNLYGSVDGVTGKIYSYGSNWNDSVTFQSASGVIKADQAMDFYLTKDGYELKYEINQITNYAEKTGVTTVTNEIRLVYRADITPYYISPFTGEQLNNDGTVYSKTEPYAYKDIADTKENRNILLLADMNIGFAGENFLPSQNITVGELKTLLKNVGYGSDITDMDDVSLITRQEIAQLFIDWIGLTKMAKLNIYVTGYADESTINTKYIGAVALAKGLGIMSGDSNNCFNPTSNLTRYDAVNLICNYIEASKGGLY